MLSGRKPRRPFIDWLSRNIKIINILETLSRPTTACWHVGTTLAFIPPASLGASGSVVFPIQGDRKMKRIQKGFTLIELMIVVAIVGILAAIALPAYQDFVVRSKMSEGTAALAACKTSTQDFVSSHSGTTPTNSAQAGCSTSSTQFVANGVAVTGTGTAAAASNTTLVAVTQNTGSTSGGGPGDCTLTLISNQGGGTFEITSWTATSGGCDTKYVPSSFR
jgi:type IV pilus assembly protein PilA